MGRHHKITDDMIPRIVTLRRDEVLSLKEIAARYDVSCQTIVNVIKKAQKVQRTNKPKIKKEVTMPKEPESLLSPESLKSIIINNVINEGQRIKEAWKAQRTKEPESLESQIDRLAKFILAECDGYPRMDCGAVDCAIQIIKDLKGKNALDSLKQHPGVLNAVEKHISELRDDLARYKMENAQLTAKLERNSLA